MSACQGCPNRKLGCREKCPSWAAHEEEKARRYAKKQAAMDAQCICPMAVAGARKNLHRYKQGRR